MAKGTDREPPPTRVNYNKYVGKLNDSNSITEELLRKATISEACKVNIYSNGRLA